MCWKRSSILRSRGRADRIDQVKAPRPGQCDPPDQTKMLGLFALARGLSLANSSGDRLGRRHEARKRDASMSPSTTLLDDAADVHRPTAPVDDLARRALIVEDEPVLREHLARILTHQGFEVDAASEGKSAAQLLSDQAYEVIITDLVLPVGSGLEVVQQACMCDAPSAVVLITGYLSADVGRQAFLAGATDFLEKPFTRERLLASLP